VKTGCSANCLGDKCFLVENAESPIALEFSIDLLVRQAVYWSLQMSGIKEKAFSQEIKKNRTHFVNLGLPRCRQDHNEVVAFWRAA
jgi:hypothetical protein